MAGPPDPIPEFRARLRELRKKAGNPSYEALRSAAGQVAGSDLPKQTTGDMLSGSGVPRWPTVETFVLACRRYAESRKQPVPAELVDLSRWKRAYDQARRSAEEPADGPLRRPYRAADTAETPVRLLRAEYAVVPFVGRDELTVLLDWCQQIADGDRTGIAVVYGVGGAGKTRLALELAHRLHAGEWSAGVLPKDTDPGPLALVKGPLLVVLDYADGRVRDAIALLKVLRTRSGPPAVVVFTARSSGGQWLTDIVGSLDDDRHAYRREEIDLPDNHPNPHGIYARTVAALSPDVQGRAEPAPEVRWTTLDLVLLGWIAAAGVTTLPATREELYDEVLRHEENYWCTVYTRFRADVAPERALLRRAAACVSLVAPPEQDVDTVLIAINDLGEDPVERRVVRRVLLTCLSPASGEGLALRPDPVADHLLRELLRADALVRRVLTRVDDSQFETALLAMDRAGAQDVVTDLIVTLVEADTSRWRAVLTVAAERAGVALGALKRLADRPDSPLPLDDLSAAIPLSSPSLFELGLIVDERRLDRARTMAVPDDVLSQLLMHVYVRANKAGAYQRALTCVVEAVDRYRQLAEEDPAAHREHLAVALNNLGAVLSALGRHEETLELVREATGIARELAGRDARAYLPMLATSLASLGLASSKAGQHDDALRYCHEAVELSRDLAADDPVFAMSSQFLAFTWSRLGNYDKALECSLEILESRRRMAADDPHCLPELAEGLNNVGAMLLRLGRYEEAREVCAEAVNRFRELATNNPVRYQPSLATALYNLGGVFTKLGRAELALQSNVEAADIYRGLSSRNPAAHRPDFAMSLNNLAGAFLCAGKYEQASAASRDAVAIYRDLVAESAAWQPELAISLATFGTTLVETDSLEERLSVLQEAADLYRQLVVESPDYRADLAGTLYNIGNALSSLAQPESSLEHYREAANLYRTLVADNPSAHLPEFARTLRKYGEKLIELRDLEQALPICAEAVDLCRRLAAHDAAVHLPDLATSLHNLAVVLSECGHYAEALPRCQNAVALRRTVAAHDPATGFVDLVASSDLLAVVSLRVGLFELALGHSQYAATCYQRLADADPAAYQWRHAGALDNVAMALTALGRHEQAIEPSRTIVDLCRTGNHAEPDLARALNNLGARLAAVGRFEEALVPVEEAVVLRRELAADDVDHLPDLAASLSNFGILLSETGQHERAVEPSNEAVLLFRKLADENPDYRLGLASSLSKTGSILFAAARHEQALEHTTAARAVWNEVFTAVRDSHLRAVHRTELARWTMAAGAPDQARRDLQLAAQEADAPPGDNSLAQVGIARQTVRTAARELAVHDLPTWATAALPDAHLELLTAVGSAADWPSLRTALDGHRDSLASAELPATLDVYQALRPTDRAPHTLRHILEEVGTHGYDRFVGGQQARHTHMKLITAWTATESWEKSAEFFHENREALTNPEFGRTLATVDHDVCRQHMGIVHLATTLTPDQAYSIVTDPAIAEEAAFDAIEAGDVARLTAVAAAAPDLRARATTWSLLSAVLCLTEDDRAEAMRLGREIAERGSPILRRAHAVRLRSFGAHNPGTAGIQDLVTIIDPTGETSATRPPG